MENEMITLNELVLKEREEDFITFLDVDEKTIGSYKVGIASFMEYLKVNNIKYPTRNDFRGYREFLKQSKTSNTINTYLTSVRALFKYLDNMSFYEDITQNIKNVKTSNSPRHQVLSEEQIKNIYVGLTNKRDKAIFSLAFTTGLRANEIALAKIENIKEYNGEIVLFIKCKKRDDESEYVKLSPLVLDNIKDYIGHRTSGYIFISTSNNNYGAGMTHKSIRCIIKRIFKENGIDEDYVSCHTLRRTMATISYNHGADLIEIKNALHQHSTQTTQRYINACVRNNSKLEYNLSKLILEN